MTIIESFEKAPIDNIISALESRADKIIFLGNYKFMHRAASIYKNLLKSKGISSEIILYDIKNKDLDSILETLTSIIESESDCIFDITGGEDLVLLAFGIIYERYKNTKAIQLKRFNVREEDYPLDVKELISLYGGIVIPEEPQPMIENALDEVNKIWNLARRNSSRWNRTHSYFKELERKGERSHDELEMYLNLSEMKKKIVNYDVKFHDTANFLRDLAKSNLMLDVEIKQDILSYKYKNPFIKRCLEKAGDALEMKAYCEALALTVDGKPYFNDCYVSVNIDWDGVIHSLEGHWKDTTNEIDLILMKGLTPIFISCKNGKIGEEELYKLNTVAHRFGGKYAKKVLLATKLERESADARKSYMQRAKDMGIMLISNAGQFTKEAWQDLYLQL